MSEIIEIDTDEDYNNNNTNNNNVNKTPSYHLPKEKYTNTTLLQDNISKDVKNKLQDDNPGTILSSKIEAFLIKAIDFIHKSHQSLDSSKVWISFWVINGLDMIKKLDQIENISTRTSNYLSKLQNVDGGFGGGYMHTSHVVSTFAAVSAIYAIGTEEAYRVIDRASMYRFLMRMKTNEGAFRSECEGEVDSRTTYCAIAIASMLNILTPELKSGVAEYLTRCQTYEGGFGAYPGNEAHGGYTFCSVAALSILDKLDSININTLHRWMVFRQNDDGGFQGRTNKLVDTCYAYWQGAVYIIIQSFLNIKNSKIERINKESSFNTEKLLFDQKKLQEYVILCCQDSNGGFTDHPHKGRDYYHTCYGLSGLSLSQHNDIANILSTMNNNTFEQTEPPVTQTSDNFLIEDGPILEPVHPIYNITLEKCKKGLIYYHSLPQQQQQ
eukprot:gene6214-7737_t